MTRSAVIVSATAFLLTVPLESSTALAQTSAEVACRAALAKESNKYLKKAIKAVTKCHKFRNKGKVALAVDCNDLAQADPNGKLDNARGKTAAKMTAACQQAPGLLAQYGRCPSPANAVDDGGATTGIDDYAELADCLIGLIDGYVGHAGTEVMGLPASKPSKNLAKCQNDLGKGVSKLLVTIGRERARCQAERDANGLGLDYGCNTADPRGKIAKAREKFDGRIEKRCAVDDDPTVSPKRELDALGACGDTIDQLKECAGDVVAERLGAGLIAMAYELPSTCPVGGLVRTFRAGAGDQFTDTFLSTGWTGTSHLVDVIDRAVDPVVLTCDDDCAACQVSLDPFKDTPAAICRCEADPTIPCDTINGPDLDDCGLLNNTCNCNLGSPLALSSGGVPVCVLNRYVADHVGTMNLGTGQWDVLASDNAKVFLGENTQLEPCPICDGDDVPLDGIRNGTCTRGARVGLPCDETANHPDFGPMSHDCPPNSLTNVSGDGLQLALDFKTAPQSQPFELPCDAPPGALCPCLVCSGDSLVGCASNADCEAVNAGTCTASGGAGARPNACSDGICTNGECANGPTETFCDGIVRQNGRGFLQCNTDVDCAALDAGSCTIQQNRPCYPDPITIAGSGTPFGGSLSSIFCIPPTTSAAVNNSAGLPGAGAVTLNMDMDATCASDPSVIWEPPAGVNCP